MKFFDVLIAVFCCVTCVAAGVFLGHALKETGPPSPRPIRVVQFDHQGRAIFMESEAMLDRLHAAGFKLAPNDTLFVWSGARFSQEQTAADTLAEEEIDSLTVWPEVKP
jgi:hypothetical protein